MSRERAYILKRKIKAFFEGLVYRMCRVFPADKSKVVMWTFEGTGGYGCNPKYIAEEMLRRNREEGTDFKIYWIVDDLSKQFPKEITMVKDNLLNRAYTFSTSGIWVGNTRTFMGTQKRRGQIYVQTWHGTVAIKPIGLYRKEKFSKIAELVSRSDSRLIDCVISNCCWCDEHYRLGLLYDGEIADIGMPRCDVLFNSRAKMREKYRTLYTLPEDAKIVMYAPTFRGGSQATARGVSAEEITIDLDGVTEELSRKFDGEWYVFLRLHPQLAAKMKNKRYASDRIINVTLHSDMNELIAASDAFITDYSSAIFEAALCKMPCFIYADDLAEYVSDRGELFWELSELPFASAQNNEELFAAIREFDGEKYREAWERFDREVEFNENGNSAKNAVDWIMTRVDGKGVINEKN